MYAQMVEKVEGEKKKKGTVVKVGEAIQGTYVPADDQAEEEKTLNGCEGGRGHTSHKCTKGEPVGRMENSQQL